MTIAAEAEAEAETETNAGVEGNARLTGLTALLLLVALAVEGVTVFDVQQMIVVHLFVGLLLVPMTALKLASTGWRLAKYYRGVTAYRSKGPPHPILRVLGPVVIVSSVSLLATGVTLLIVGPNSASRDTVLTLHQGSFIVWVAAMTIHVVGHLKETFELNKAELSPQSSHRVAGGRQRKMVLALSVIVGIGLGIGSLTWNHAWKTRQDREPRQSVVTAVPTVASRP